MNDIKVKLKKDVCEKAGVEIAQISLRIDEENERI